MTQKLYSVAAQLYCSPAFMNQVRIGNYRAEKFVLVAKEAATQFLIAIEQSGFEGNPAIALAYLSNRLGDGLVLYKEADLLRLSLEAIEQAAEFERVMAPVLGQVPKLKKPSVPVGDDVVDLPIEQCGLPKLTVDTLAAAGYTTGQSVIDGDKQGRVVGLTGIQEATRDKIISKIRDSMKAAAEKAAEKKPSETGSETVAPE